MNDEGGTEIIEFATLNARLISRFVLPPLVNMLDSTINPMTPVLDDDDNGLMEDGILWFGINVAVESLSSDNEVIMIADDDKDHIVTVNMDVCLKATRLLEPDGFNLFHNMC